MIKGLSHLTFCLGAIFSLAACPGAEAEQTRRACLEALANPQYHEMACYFSGYKYYDDREGSNEQALKLLSGYYKAPAHPERHTKHFALLTLGDLDDLPMSDGSTSITLQKVMAVDTFETRDRHWFKVPVITDESIPPSYTVSVSLMLTPIPILPFMSERFAHIAARPETPDSPLSRRANPQFDGMAAAVKPTLFFPTDPYKVYDGVAVDTNPLQLLSTAAVASPILSDGYNSLYTIDSCEQYKSPFYDPITVKISCKHFDSTRLYFFPAVSPH